MKNIRSYRSMLLESTKRLDSILMDYVENEDAEACEALIEAGANPDATTSDGEHALTFAIRKGYNDVAKVLLKGGADPDVETRHRDVKMTALMLAAWMSESELVEALIDHGARENTKNENGWNALHIAAREGCDECCRILIEKADIEINPRSKQGRTPLLEACMFDNDGAVEILLENGADANIGDNDGYTPLFYAKKDDNNERAKLLINAGAKIEGIFKDRQDIIDFFNGDLSWWNDPPEEVEDIVSRMKKTKRLFNR